MKSIFFIAIVNVLLTMNASFAQVRKAEILATGLTCSMCSNAIYKQLTTLEHVLFGGFTHEPAIKVAKD